MSLFFGKMFWSASFNFFRRIQNFVNNFFNLNNPVNGPFFLRATDHSLQDIYMNLFAKVGYTDLFWIIFRKKFWSTTFYFFRRVLDRSTRAFWTNYAQNQEINWLVSSTYRPQFSRYQHESFCNVWINRFTLSYFQENVLTEVPHYIFSYGSM